MFAVDNILRVLPLFLCCAVDVHASSGSRALPVASCASTNTCQGSTGSALLQSAGRPNTEHKAEPDTLTEIPCKLPDNAKLCEVKLNGLRSFKMAVRAGNDVVSGEICSKGFWEVSDFAMYGFPGQAMDIGGNMGYFTFSLVHSGWKVITFEPMKENLDLIDATICENPGFKDKIELHRHGLGSQNKKCKFVVHPGNLGNGITSCDDETNLWWENMDNFKTGAQQYEIRKFDEVLKTLKVNKLDFVKLDVEGYECEVLNGAPEFLKTFHPRLVRTEAWPHQVKCESIEYLSKFLNSGYVLSRDADCAKEELDLNGGDYYACLDDSKKLLEKSNSCPELPSNARLCEVRLQGVPKFKMAVRAGNDVVSGEVCKKGFWEVKDFSVYGKPGQAMDIGGNMGYFTFALANSGWKVITFEPMKANLDLINATLCENPQFRSRVEIHPHGLSAENKRCKFVVHPGNLGNGITTCEDDSNLWWENMNDFKTGEQEYQLRNFNEVLGELKMKKLDFVKLDVEGYECEVLKGAPEFLKQYSPRLIRTEAWPHQVHCESTEYLSKFIESGYTLSRDAACGTPEGDLGGGDYYACKTDVSE